jgi:hypothetical protein
MTLCAAAAACVLALAFAAEQGAAADGLVCVNANRDWNRVASTLSLDDARRFLSVRVKPECRQLRARVNGRIAQLEQASRQAREEETEAAVTATPVRRPKVPAKPRVDSRPTPSPPPPRQARPTPPPSPTVREPVVAMQPPPSGYNYQETRDFQVWQPDWYQVLARYPHLERLFGRGGNDLCARCIVGPSGYLRNCAIAGSAATNPEIRRGAQAMISMIYIRRRDGSPAAGSTTYTPVWFGRSEEPAASICRRVASDYRY